MTARVKWMEPGQILDYVGYAVLAVDDKGVEFVVALDLSRELAIVTANAALKGRRWRVLPVAGRITVGATSVKPDGSVDMVFG